MNIQDFSDDEEKLLEQLLAERGFGDDDADEAGSRPDRSRQLEKFLDIVETSGGARPVQAGGETLESTMERTLTNSAVFQEAYQDASKVVFVGTFMCPEILFSMGLSPFNVEMLSAFLAANGTAQHFLDIGEKNHIARDACSVVRCVLGAAIDDCLPTPDFVAFASYPCDTSSKMMYALSRHYKTPYFVLDIPHRRDEEAARRMAARLREMKEAIERALGIEADHDKLTASIANSKEALSWYEKMIALCQKHGVYASVGKSINDIISYTERIGKREVVDSIRIQYEEFADKVKRSRPPAAGAGVEANHAPLVVWKGLTPYYTDEILTYFEKQCGIRIIHELALGDIHLQDLIHTDDPYLFLAKKLLATSVSAAESFETQNWDAYETYGVDGAVIFNQWGCRHMLSRARMHRDELSRKNLSVLEIDGDFVDSGSYSFSQLKVRIDAFAEMLKRRKKEK